MTNSRSKKIVILGGGPAGLYSAVLIKKANPGHDISVIERNPADVTYGWGVVFSDRTLASFQRADYRTYEQITEQFVIWDAIDVHYRGETIRCGGHVIAAISRKRLLNILQRRCEELGVEVAFGRDMLDMAELPECDLVIAADGVNSLARRTYEEHFKSSIELGRAKYIWLGADKVLDAFNFIFHENEHGLFQVHAYPFSGTTSTFIVECDEATWLNAGLDKAGEAESLAYCQELLREDLGGTPLLSNNSKWINFPTLRTRNWSVGSSEYRVASTEGEGSSSEARVPGGEPGPWVVLLGDAVHTAHFSIGAGTKLAMEDSIALAAELEKHSDLETALNEYELERKPVVETFQRAARESQTYFETIKRYLGLEPAQFAFQLLTRSGRISYNDLKLRDARYGDSVDRWFAGGGRGSGVGGRESAGSIRVAPPPMFAPFEMRGLVLPNRVVVSPILGCPAVEGVPGEGHERMLGEGALGGAGLVMTEICSVSAEGRITPGDVGMYAEEHRAAWARIIEWVHAGGAKAGAQLGHAGRRGATRPRVEGPDRPLREGAWPLVAASPIPYTPRSQVPAEIDRAGMEAVREAFTRAARLADEAGFDWLQLHFAHGYLLAGFLSPLTNMREDEYGGDMEGRARFPLEVFDSVRAACPEGKPVSVALSVADCARGGLEVEDGVEVAKLLKSHGCDLIAVLVGQTTLDADPSYGRGFLTPLSDRVRNGAGIATMVGGYLTTSNDVNTILAAGRGDLCIVDTA
ncbi:MAG: FAD-dependent monooxygenase [Chloroflexia bacterium]